jgi:excisionase family DNA binding protein
VNAATAEFPEVVRLLTVAAAAEALAVSERTLRSLIAEGSFPIVRVSARRVRFHPEDLRRFIEERRGRQGA